MQTKKWFQSKTIWGLIIAMLGFVISHFLQVDVQVPQDATFDELTKYAEAIKEANGNVQSLLSQLMMLVGTIVAFIGRVKAETKVTL